jgi:hypothetical protein
MHTHPSARYTLNGRQGFLCRHIQTVISMVDLAVQAEISLLTSY